MERRLAILGFHGPRDFVKSALNDPEKAWIDACDSVKPGAKADAYGSISVGTYKTINAEGAATLPPLSASVSCAT